MDVGQIRSFVAYPCNYTSEEKNSYRLNKNEKIAALITFVALTVFTGGLYGIFHLVIRGFREFIKNTNQTIENAPSKITDAAQIALSLGKEKLVATEQANAQSLTEKQEQDLAEQAETYDQKIIELSTTLLFKLVNEGKPESLEKAKKYIQQGIDIDVVGADGLTMLQNACINGHLEAVKWLIDNGADPNKKIKYDNSTPLMKACYANHDAIITILLAHPKLNVNEQDIHGRTALMFAAQSNNLQAVQKLLDKKANVNATDKDSWTPLTYACMKNNAGLDIVKILINAGAKDDGRYRQGTALLCAVQAQKQEIVEFLIQKKTNLDVQDNSGITPLMHACINGNEEIVKLLLNNGANVTLLDKAEGSAPYYACGKPRIEALIQAKITANKS